MTTKEWIYIAKEYEEDNQKPFMKAYHHLKKVLKPKFKKKYGSVHFVFENIFNDKIMEILLRTINNQLTFSKKNIDPFLYRAIDNAYKDELRKGKSFDNVVFEDYRHGKTASYTSEEDYREVSSMFDICESTLKKSIVKLDVIGEKIITKTYFENKKPKQIMKELNWAASSAAFSDKKKRTLRNLRKFFFEELRK